MQDRQHANPITRQDQRGFTLIEILIAVLVLSFGLLGLAMLQATGLKYNTDSYMRTQATLVAYSIMDRIRANPKGADAGNYVSTAAVSGYTCGDSATFPGCGTEQDLANYDLTQWYALQQSALGQQNSTIARFSTNTPSGQSVWEYQVTVNWTEHQTPLTQTWILQVCKLTTTSC